MRTTSWPLCCALMAASAHAQSDYALRAVNHLRAPGGACASSAPPAIPQNTLDAAAAQVARGVDIKTAMQSAGYRMTQAQVISVSGSALRTQLEPLLAKRFCAQITSTQLPDIGIHESESKQQLWIVLAAPFAPKVDLTRKQVAERMLALVNQARAAPRRCGDKNFDAAPALTWNETLTAAAAQHAKGMATQDYFSHDGRDGSTPAQRVSRGGYRYRTTGENIAAGQLSLEAAMAGWLKSPGHCANIMKPSYTELGAAFAVNAASRMGVYWAQEFGAPM